MNVTRQVFLNDLSSASGITWHNNKLYVVGDDAPWLYILDEELSIIEKIKISGIDSLVNGRMPKSVKPDFESIEYVNDGCDEYLLIFSSGSVQISRDTAFVVRLDPDSLKHRNLRPFYEHIKERALIGTLDEINIEGLAVDEQNIYLFHRGNVSGNFIAVFERSPLMAYLENEPAAFPEARNYHFELPEYDQLISGFSGACMMPDNKGILFTASVENTADVINDGEVLGSYVGIISPDGLLKGTYRSTLVYIDGKTLPVKLEGITIKSFENNKMIVYAVSDNDDGTSEILEMEIFY